MFQTSIPETLVRPLLGNTKNAPLVLVIAYSDMALKWKSGRVAYYDALLRHFIFTGNVGSNPTSSAMEAARHGRGHCLENSWSLIATRGFDSLCFRKYALLVKLDIT